MAADDTAARAVLIDARLAERLHREADARRWQVSTRRLADALEASAAKVFGDRTPEPAQVDRYLNGLHLADLALACACADGHEAAWEHFIREQRPVLYRAADSIDPSGGARDLADEIYADLFSKSLFKYFHGRSTLSTWLRAVLAQRHVDRLRSARRTDALPGDESLAAMAAPAPPVDPERERRAVLTRQVIQDVVLALAPNDRLRLACYYHQELTLAQTGTLVGEHEATVSRNLARTRREIRASVESRLRAQGLSEAAMAEALAAVAEDAGPFDLAVLLGDRAPRKESGLDRSTVEGESVP